jgi:hypothetical protein
MRHDYGHVPGWPEWFDTGSSRLSAEESHLLRRFNELRIRTEKRSALEPQLVPLLIARMAPLEPSSQPDGLEGGAWYGPSYDPPAGVVWFLTLDDTEVPVSCKRYLEFLERIVDECEARFGVPGTSTP